MAGKRGMIAGVGLGMGLLAAALGFAFYLIGPTGDNAARACPLSQSAETLDPLATGEVAAFIVHETPVAPPEIAFTDGAGEPKTLADWAGQTVLLNVWATWCAPCRYEMPALDALQAELGGEAFEVVAVSIDAGGDEKPRDFLDEVAAENLAFYHDPTTDVFSGLRAAGRGIGLPVTLLIDAHGCEVGYLAGPAEWSSDDALALVRAVLNG
ncbi:MAG: TlpA disulfide reductase family protein [Pseudomonadota bacterium]